MRNRLPGFTLIELLVVVALFSIVTTLAVGAYRQYVQRTNRTDATQLLLRVMAAQERFYLDNNQYANDPVALIDPPESEKGHYRLTIGPGVTGDFAIDYVATAQVIAGGAQADDADCNRFTIDQAGTRGSQPMDEKTCWK